MNTKKYFVWNPSICACEINRYLKTITDDLVAIYAMEL